MKRFKIILVFIIVMGISGLIIFYPKASCCGVKNGLDFCFMVLIPSLFPFMIISSFIVKSGISDIIGKVGGGATKILFRLPGITFATVIISLIGGYPTGARGIRSLVDSGSITKKQAELMLLFCVGAGPGFVINAVGCNMFNDFNIGVILFLSQILSSLMLGIICSVFYKKSFINDVKTVDVNIKKNENISISKALITSVSDSIISIMNMCGFVILFSCLISVLEASGFIDFIASLLLKIFIPNSISYSVIPSVLEVTTGCKVSVANKAPIEFIAFVLGFSGICVHFQIFSMINISFSKLKFILARLAHGIMAALNSYILLNIFPISRPVCFSTAHIIGKQDISLNLIGVLSLILMSAVFLLSLREGENT